MYCALNFELQNLPILSEYSHTKDGRVDSFIFDKKWGIEVLQCGSMSTIAEHAARFAVGGKYREWNIFKDYIILNFCSKSTVRKIEIEGNNFPVIRDGLFLIIDFFNADIEVQSRILQVAVDSNEYTAEVYTYDKELLVTLTLGEGRHRFDADECDSPSEDSGVLKIMQNQLIQMKQEKEDMSRQLKQVKDDMSRQLKQMKDDTKLQTRS